MSDDLDIRGGGAVAVDTGSLRDAAERFADSPRSSRRSPRLTGSAGSQLFTLPRVAWDVSGRVEVAAAPHRRGGEGADRADHDLRSAAAVYELVELAAARGVAESAGDSATVALLDRRIAALGREYPDAGGSAMRSLTWPGELTRQAAEAVWWAPPGIALGAGAGVFGALQLARVAGAGTVARGERLRAAPTAIRLEAVQRDARAAAPSTLAEAAARVPGGGATRIRVEKYTMRDGSRQFAVYVAGTQALRPLGADPFDMTSNVQLYTGSRSASYDATLAALRACRRGSPATSCTPSATRRGR